MRKLAFAFAALLCAALPSAASAHCYTSPCARYAQPAWYSCCNTGPVFWVQQVTQPCCYARPAYIAPSCCAPAYYRPYHHHWYRPAWYRPFVPYYRLHRYHRPAFYVPYHRPDFRPLRPHLRPVYRPHRGPMFRPHRPMMKPMHRVMHKPHARPMMHQPKKK